MARETLNERRAQLTQMVVQARQQFESIQVKVKYEVRKANPGLKESDWAKFYQLVDDDPRVQVAGARLLALCDAANVMGAEIF